MPWLAILGFLLLAAVTMLEAVLCIVMLLPAYLLSASAGGWLMGFYLDSKNPDRRGRLGISVILVVPYLFSPIESEINSPTATNTVITEIFLEADKETVWNNIKSVSAIREDELQWSFAHFIGIPKPVESVLNREAVGGTRYISWEKGIRFREIITDWRELESFSYNILVDHIPAEAIDQHVEVGGRYFKVLYGGYQLTAIDRETTKLTLSCTYSLTTNFNFYSQWWANYIIDDFQKVILGVIKGRCEKKI
jgi:hypothetical protein